MTVSHLSSSESVSPVVLPWAAKPSQTVVTPQIGKVLHIINGEFFSGAERVQQLLGKRLEQFGYSTEFACVKPEKFPELCGLRANQVSQFPMGGRFDIGVAKKITKKVIEESFDILHAHTPRTALVTSLVSLWTGVPWVYHVHSPTARDSTRGVVNRINLLIERYSIKSCNHLITVSKSLRRQMLQYGVDRRCLSVVPNGVPAIEPVVPATRATHAVWKMGMIALMRPRKGVEVALAAMRELKRREIPVQLNLIGGFESEAYQSQILEMIMSFGLNDTVRWTGFTNDVPTAIRELDGLLLPSLFGEGMPMVVLEALAAGVPVVATRVEGTPEVIRDGVEGFLAEPQNAQSLTEKIEEFTQCRRQWQALSHNALIRHRASFTDEVMAQRVARVYSRILDKI